MNLNGFVFMSMREERREKIEYQANGIRKTLVGDKLFLRAYWGKALVRICEEQAEKNSN